MTQRHKTPPNRPRRAPRRAPGAPQLGRGPRWRNARYHRQVDLRICALRPQAREFINRVGFCFLFPAPGVELPSLWEAMNGKTRAIPKHHHDHALSLAWTWKDSLPAQKAVWYGKLLRGKPMFVALDLLPAFYALSENYGELDDYRQQFADGRMSVEARTVYEVLLENGPLSTNAMRKAAGLFGKGETARRFERAVQELQQDLKIVKCGVSDDNRWKYCYVYDLLLRCTPDLAERARAISWPAGAPAIAACATWTMWPPRRCRTPDPVRLGAGRPAPHGGRTAGHRAPARSHACPICRPRCASRAGAN